MALLVSGAFLYLRFDMYKLVKQLKRHEGFRSNYYLCTRNKETIGYGRNVDDNPFSLSERDFLGRVVFDNQPMTKQEAEFLLINDIKATLEAIKSRLPWSELNEARRAVCVNMAFNLGVAGFFGFKNMIAAMFAGNHEQVVFEMLDSKYARYDVPERANELAEQFLKGEFNEYC